MAAFSAIAGFSMQPLSSRMAWVHTGGNRPHFRAGSRLLGILKTSKYSSAQTASLVNLYIFTKQFATKYSSLAHWPNHLLIIIWAQGMHTIPRNFEMFSGSKFRRLDPFAVGGLWNAQLLSTNQEI